PPSIRRQSRIDQLKGWLGASCYDRYADYTPVLLFFFSSRRRHTRCLSDWSSDVCSSDLGRALAPRGAAGTGELRRQADDDRHVEIGRASCRERVQIAGGSPSPNKQRIAATAPGARSSTFASGGSRRRPSVRISAG